MQPLTSFCHHQPGEISCMSVSCFLVEPGPQSITVPALVHAKGMGGEWGGGDMSERIKGVEVIENCGHDCSNPVISLAKAGHSSDLETQMLSCLCLSPLLLFSLLPALSHSL